MRKKSLCHQYLSWFLLLGMLFHVFVAHQDGISQLLLNHVHKGHNFAEGVERVHVEADHEYHDAEEHSHSHPLEPPHSHALEHPEAYPRQSNTEVQDLFDLRLTALQAHMPLLVELPKLPLQWSNRFDLTEPQPPPEQLRRALSSIILLI